MRLRRVALDRFHDTQRLELELAEPELPLRPGAPRVTFFVGPNGTGKSRVLEHLGLIFSHLAIRRRPGVDFELEYAIAGNDVLVTTDQRAASVAAGDDPPSVEPGLWVLVKREREQRGWTREDALARWPTSTRHWLPRRVYGYSTGPVTGLEWALRESTERAVADELAQGTDGVEEERLQRFRDNPVAVAVTIDDALLPALALFAHPGPRDPQARAELDRRRALLRERVEFADEQPLAGFSLDLAENWSALLHGRLQSMLAELVDTADRIVVAGGSSGIRAVFDPSDRLRDVVQEHADTPLVWYEQLHAWWRRGALTRCHLALGKQRHPALFRDADLSDGEFLLLGRYALLMLVAEEDGALVLLDEPDTHFNDQWKAHLVKDVSEMLAVEPGSERAPADVIVATHSDLTLTDADRACVQVFSLVEHEDGAEGMLEVTRPAFSPFAADRADIAREVFDLTATIGDQSLERIDAALQLDSVDELQRVISRTGPGFHRYRLQRRLEELEETDVG